MARSPWKIDPTNSGGGDPRVPGSSDWIKAMTAGLGGSGFKFNMPQTVEDWFMWNQLIGTGQANIPKGGFGFNASFGGGGGGNPSPSATSGNPSTMGGKPGLGWFGGSGGTGGGLGGMTWGDWISAGLGAYSAYSQNEAMKNAGKQSSTSAPWGPSQNILMDLLNRANLLSQQGAPPFYGPPPKVGMNSTLQNALGMIEGMAGNSPFVGDAQTIGNQITNNQHNPIMNYLFQGGGGKVNNPYMDQFIQQGFGGGFENDLLKNFITSGLGGFGGPGGGGGFSPAPFTFQGIEPNDWMRAVLDGEWLSPDKNPFLAEQVENLRREGLETYKRSIVPQIDSQYARSGRFGSNHYATAQAMANEEANESINTASSQFLGDNYARERAAMMQAMGLLSNQDIANLQSQTSIHNTNTNAAASSAAAGMAADSQNRQTMLQALLGYGDQRLAGLGMLGDMIGNYSGDRQFEIASLGELAGQLSSDKLGYLSLIPGLEDARWRGPNELLNAGNIRQQHMGANANNQYNYEKNKWQYETSWPYEQLEFLANMAIPIGGLGGQSNTSTPFTGPSSFEAALMGGLGGYTFWQGMKNPNKQQAPNSAQGWLDYYFKNFPNGTGA